MPYLFLSEVREGDKMVVVNVDLVVNKIEDNANITVINGRLIVQGSASSIGKNVSINCLQKNLTLLDGSQPIAWAGYKGSYFESYSALEGLVERELPEYYSFLYGKNQGDREMIAESQAWVRAHPEPQEDLSAMMSAFRAAASANGNAVGRYESESKKCDRPNLEKGHFPNDVLTPSNDLQLFFAPENTHQKPVEIDVQFSPAHEVREPSGIIFFARNFLSNTLSSLFSYISTNAMNFVHHFIPRRTILASSTFVNHVRENATINNTNVVIHSKTTHSGISIDLTGDKPNVQILNQHVETSQSPRDARLERKREFINAMTDTFNMMNRAAPLSKDSKLLANHFIDNLATGTHLKSEARSDVPSIFSNESNTAEIAPQVRTNLASETTSRFFSSGGSEITITGAQTPEQLAQAMRFANELRDAVRPGR